MIESLYLHSLRPQEKPLRVGILLDSLRLSPAQDAVLRHLAAADFLHLALIVLPASGTPKQHWHSSRLFSLYQRLDQRLNAGFTARFAPVDCAARLTAVPQLTVLPEYRGSSTLLPATAVQQIRLYDLDVLLRFGFGILRGEALTAARHGVWSYHHGDNHHYRGGPPSFWEMYERNPLTGVLLQVLNEELDGGQVLTKAITPTASGTSLLQNRVAPSATGETFVIRKLWELHSYGPQHLQAKILPAAPYTGKKKLYRAPGNFEMLRFLPRLGQVAWNRVRGGHDDIARWRIAVRRPPLAQPWGGPDGFNHQGFAWLEPPAGHFYADPFPLQWQGQDWIFFEDYYTGRGRLAAAPLLPTGQLGPVELVLDRPYHLSYPFLWQQDGELFMIPETGANRTVELYRCTRFPGEWKQERVLFEGPAADTTILAHEGRLWFFVSLLDRPASAQLFLFSARSLWDKWEYHPANPISLDIRTARCGGAFWQDGHRLIRVAQDGSRRYGYALRFLEVQTLNPHEYQEAPVAALLPEQMGQGLRGVHTYNRSATLELLDGQWREPKSHLS